MAFSRHVVVSALAAAGLAGGCSSGSAPVASTGSARAGGSTPHSCGRSAAAPSHWPAGVPADMPRPAGGRITDTKAVAHGVVVEVTVPSSLRQQVVFAEKALPKAGFALARGDAEADEADIPFRRGGVTGQLRIRAGGACRATWILTVLNG